jgi:hypothetical protein
MGRERLSSFEVLGECMDLELLSSPAAGLLSSVESRVKESKMEAIASNEVGERTGRERKFKTGSRSLDGAEVGVEKVSPFFKLILKSGESVDIVGRVVFKTGRRRGCSRDGSG